MKRIRWLLTAGLLLVSFTQAAPVPANPVATAEPQDEHVVFIKTPIHFVVPVGQERLLSFPDRITLTNTNPALTRDKVTLYNNHGTLYVTAKKAFAPILLPIHLVHSDQVALIYLSASAEAVDHHPLDVVMPSISPSAYHAPMTTPTPTVTLNAVTLLRYAAQQLSLKRLARQPAGISRTPMYTHHVVTLFRNGGVQAFPSRSWRGGDLYVTAVRLLNTTNQTLHLSAQSLRGHWQAASFYRFDAMQTLVRPVVPFSVVTPRGTKRDATWLLLVSHQPFGPALGQLPPFIRSEKAHA